MKDGELNPTHIPLMDVGFIKIADQLSEALFLATFEGRLVFANSTLCRLTGFNQSELLGKALGELTLSRSYEPHYLENWGKTGIRFVELRRKNNSSLPAEVSESKVSVGGQTHLLGTIRSSDTQTHRKFVVDRFSAQFKDLMASMSEFMWNGIMDQEGNFSHFYCSDEVESIAGRPKELYQDGLQNWLEVIHPEDRPRMETVTKKVMGGEISAAKEEYRIVWPDGSTRWILDRVTGCADEQGRLHFFGVVTDLTQMRSMQKQLHHSEHLYRELVMNASWGIMVHGVEQVIRFCNPRAAEILGIPLESLQGLKKMEPDAKLVREDGSEMPFDEYPAVRAIETQKPLANMVSGVDRPDRERVWVMCNAFPVFDENGEFDSVVVSFSDITPLKKIEQERLDMADQVQKAQKLESLGVLAGGIAHDFNNLLVGIVGSANLALELLSIDAKAREFLEQIEVSAQRATELVHQLLAYSGKGQFVVEPVDLGQLVQGMGELIKLSLSKNVSLHYSLTESLPAVEADATQLRQIIMNLLVNASDALGDSGGDVTVSTGWAECDATDFGQTVLNNCVPTGRYAFFQVSDNGCGMDEATQKRIFDPFFSTKVSGRGLGLSAALGIVRSHRGAIQIKSESGQGTSITVWLPTMDSSAATKYVSAEQPKATELPKATVLLVDDEETVRNVGRKMLEHLGQTVRLATDGLQALEILRQAVEDIDYLILDLTMPNMDGETCLRELRSFAPNLPVIVSSGYSRQEVSRFLAHQKHVRFVQKPYRLQNLEQVLIDTLLASVPEVS